MTNRAAHDTDELLDRAGRGDVAARLQLLDRHRNQLRHMVTVRLDRRLLSHLDPSDVVQETLAEAVPVRSEVGQALRIRLLKYQPKLLIWPPRIVNSEKYFSGKSSGETNRRCF